MATLDMVTECLLALNERTGSSLIAINKWLEAEKKVIVKKHVMRAALKSGVEKGILVPVKASYKLSVDAKANLKKKKPATGAQTASKDAKSKKVTKTASKKVAPKKAAPKKKVKSSTKGKKTVMKKKSAAQKKSMPKKSKSTSKKMKKVPKQ